MERCEACGSELDPGASECPGCGLNLGAADPPSFVLRNPLDGSALPGSGLPLVTVDEGEPPDPAPVEAPQPAQQAAGGQAAPPRTFPLAIVLVTSLAGAALLALGLWLAPDVAGTPHEQFEAALERAAARIAPAVEPPEGAALAWLAARAPEALRAAEAEHEPFGAVAGETLHALFERWLARALPLDPDCALALGVHPHPTGVTGFYDDERALARLLLLCRDAHALVSAWSGAEAASAHGRADLRLFRSLLELSLRWDHEATWTAFAQLELEANLDALVGLVGFACCGAEARGAVAGARLRAIRERAARLPARLERPAAALVASTVRRVRLTNEYLRAYPDAWPEPVAEALAPEVDATCAALERYARQLEDEVLPWASGPLGIGPQNYALLLRAQAHLPDQPAEIVLAAANELRVTRLELERVVERLSPPAPGPADEDEQAARVRARWSSALERLRRDVPQWVATAPRDDPGVRVEEAPLMWLGDGAAFYSEPGPLASPDGPAPRVLLGSLELPDTDALIEIDHTAAHETYPGHHLHHQLASESACLLRSVFDCRLVQEGWAVQAEELAHASGLHAADPQRCRFWLSADRWGFAGAAAVDVLIHTRAASPEELLAWLRLRDGEGPDGPTLADVGDAARSPAYALNYLLGPREIARLWALAAERQGPEFDPRRFRERLLRAGYAPPRVLEEELLGGE